MTRYRAEVRVTLREGLLDPQGQTVRSALDALGFEGLEEVRIGKLVQLWLTAGSRQDAEERVRAMCERLLANPVTENFAIRVVEAAETVGERSSRS